MPDITLEFALTEPKLAIIDALRDRIPRDDYLRMALEMGLLMLQEEAARVQKESMFIQLEKQTAAHELAAIMNAITAPILSHQVALPKDTPEEKTEKHEIKPKPLGFGFDS